MFTSVKSGRLQDRDNLAQSFKALRDSLSGWAIKDDTPKWVKCQYSQINRCKDYPAIGTLVTVWPILEEGAVIPTFQLAGQEFYD